MASAALSPLVMIGGWLAAPDERETATAARQPSLDNAVQLTAALDSPPLRYLSSAALDTPQACKRITQGWEDLVRRVCLNTTR
jgi:hypothetical protein